MKEEIQIIELLLDGSVEILDHPKQKEIYSEEIDKDFIESINIHGVRQMPIITPAEDVNLELIDPSKDNFVIVSGHRRIRTAQKLKLPSVLCEVRRYETVFDSEVDHLVSNKQRKKKPSEIAAEIDAYKQKLSQIRKELEKKGVKALDNYKSMRLGNYIQIDENGRPYLPFARELIEEELKIKENRQKQLSVIFPGESHNWLQDRIDEIFHSKLSAKKKRIATEGISEVVERCRQEVDKKDGLSINKAYNEIKNVWNDIDSVINPKPKEKAKKKKKNVTKRWIKPKDLVFDTDNGVIDESEFADVADVSYIYIQDEKGQGYFLEVGKLVKYLKEQGI